MNLHALQKCKEWLIARRQQLFGDVDHQCNALSRRDDMAGDLSAMPIHMADIGSDNYDKELTSGLIENEQEEVREIDAALARMVDGSYGVCESCGKKIQPTRLTALPYARLCIECKRKEESGNGG